MMQYVEQPLEKVYRDTHLKTPDKNQNYRTIQVTHKAAGKINRTENKTNGINSQVSITSNVNYLSIPTERQTVLVN